MSEITKPKAAETAESVERAILLVRGQKVMLDAELARLYGVETRVLVQAVRRNAERFPSDFLFELTRRERRRLAAKSARGGRRFAPLAFTEQGVAMLSSVLRSEHAVRVNIAIMRAFVRLRAHAARHAELVRRLDELESRCDGEFTKVFDAIRELVRPPDEGRERIGFHREPRDADPPKGASVRGARRRARRGDPPTQRDA